MLDNISPEPAFESAYAGQWVIIYAAWRNPEHVVAGASPTAGRLNYTPLNSIRGHELTSIISGSSVKVVGPSLTVSNDCARQQFIIYKCSPYIDSHVVNTGISGVDQCL